MTIRHQSGDGNTGQTVRVDTDAAKTLQQQHQRAEVTGARRGTHVPRCVDTLSVRVITQVTGQWPDDHHCRVSSHKSHHPLQITLQLKHVYAA